MKVPTFATIENFRDCAAYPCRYGNMAEGRIFRSASLSYADEADLQKVLDLGILSEIDLRGPSFWKSHPSPLKDRGVQVLELEVPHAESFCDREDQVPDWYLSFVSNPYFARQFFRAMINLPKPLLFHCEAGKDRTGALGIVLLLANGVSREDAADSYNESYRGHLPQTEARTIAAYVGLKDFVFHMKEETIVTFIDKFYDRYGTIEDYFDCIGLNEDEAEAVCNLFGKGEISAGAVVFHGNKVLVEHMAKGHYSMPKGHIEAMDGSLEKTALREILEETGLQAKIVPGFHESIVYSAKPGKIKRVHWFIATVDNEKGKPQLEEVSEIYFLPPADAMRVLSHESDRQMLAAACKAYFK